MSDDFPDPRLAERLTRAARAAQALSETLWEALQEELADPRPERVAELSVKLGEVATVLVSLARVDSARPRQQPAEPANAEQPPIRPESPVGRATTYGEPSAEEPAPSGESPETQALPSPAVLIDELAAVESPLRVETTFEPPAARPAPPFAGAPSARPIAAGRPREGDPPRKARPEIEIRDERSAEGPSAWIDSIGRRLERHERDGAPFAVLLVELVELERLRHAEPAEELARLIGRVEDALARVLRPADSLTLERPGRYWLLAPQTDGPGARVLIERIARAVRSAASHRGTPLEVAVGVAICPDDGRRASELAAHADVGLYAARAAGRPSIG